MADWVEWKMVFERGRVFDIRAANTKEVGDKEQT